MTNSTSTAWKHLTLESSISKRLGLLFILIALAVGLWGRTYELGSRQVAEDATYLVTSINYILEKGIPEYPNGGFYTRCIGLQYLIAGVVKATANELLYYRIPIVLFGLASIFFTFLYARRLSSVVIAAAMVVAMLLSSWQVEFSRFIRMYMPAQCFAMAFLYTLQWIPQYSQGWRRYTAHILCVVTISMHTLGLALLPVLALYELGTWLDQRKIDWRGLVATALAAVMGMVFFVAPKFINRNLLHDDNIQNPPGTDSSMLTLPNFPFWQISTDAKINLATVVAAAGLTAAIPWLTKLSVKDKTIYSLLLAGLVFSLGHQFVPVAICFFVLVFRFDLWRVNEQSAGKLALAVLTVVCSCLWLAYGLLHLDTLVAGTSGFGAAVRETFLGWPEIYSKTLVPWLETMPLLTGAAVICSAVYLMMVAKDSPADFLRSPIIPLLCYGLLVGVLTPLHPRTRYAFFLYPVVLFIIPLTITVAMERFTALSKNQSQSLAGLALVVLFLLSHDFHVDHLLHPTSHDANYRLGRYERYTHHWYKRFDTETVANYIDNNVPAEDHVIVSARMPQIYYYLKHDFIFYYPNTFPYGPIVETDSGLRHKWSNRPFIRTTGELADYASNETHVWIVRAREPFPYPVFINTDEIWPQRAYTSEQIYVGEDGALELIKVNFTQP